MLCCWYSIWAFSYFLCSINTYKFTIDTFLAPGEQAVIKESIKEWGMRNSFDSSLTTHLFHSFPYIDSVSARLLPNGRMHCAIKAHKPLGYINQTHLLLSDNTLINAKLYDDTITQELPALTISSASILEESIPFIAKIPQHLIYEYDITIMSQTDIRLIDRAYPNFNIRIDHDNIRTFSPDNCNRIKEDLITKNLLSQQRWVVDARFTNQLVVRSFKGVEK